MTEGKLLLKLNKIKYNYLKYKHELISLKITLEISFL